MHEIRYFKYDEDTNKKEIENEMYDISIKYSDYGGKINRRIRWLDNICEDEESAYKYIESFDNGYYDQLAVRFRVYPNCEPTKTLFSLKERKQKEIVKRNDYEKAHSIASFKVEYVGCSKCGSKLKRTLIRENSCPLCKAELRSKTTLETIKRYENNIDRLEQQIKEEQKKTNKKNIKKSKVKWLVKIEYHV